MDAEATASSVASVQPMRRRPFWFLLAFVTIPLIVLDQLSKTYVSHHMSLYDDIELIPNYLDITFTKNPGAAFSMFATMAPSLRIGLLITLISVAVIVLLVMLAQCDRINVTSFSYALILAGAAGNLIDRGLRGFEVIDFIRAHYYDYNWPVFNVADSAISIGVTLIVIATLFFREPEAKS